jgi:hypothetical protein
MKKLIGLIAAAFIAANLTAGDRFQASLAANVLLPADSAYKEIYDSTVFLPELKLAYCISKCLYAWAGYGRVSVKGETPVLKEPAESRQGFWAAGAGFRHSLSGGWGLFGELGLASIAFREEALGGTANGSALGVAVNAGVRRDLGARFFLLAQAGYVYARKTIDDVPVKMGGAKAGIGAGVRF